MSSAAAFQNLDIKMAPRTLSDILRWNEYLSQIRQYPMYRIKFYGRAGHHDPMTRQQYNIMGLCSVNIHAFQQRAVHCKITSASLDADEFFEYLMQAIADGFILPDDVVVLNNSSIHTGKDNDVLEQCLWNMFDYRYGRPLNIRLIFLPPGAPELNSMKTLYKEMVRRLHRLPGWPFLALGGQNASADAVCSIMCSFTLQDVWTCYQKCEYTW